MRKILSFRGSSAGAVGGFKGTSFVVGRQPPSSGAAAGAGATHNKAAPAFKQPANLLVTSNADGHALVGAESTQSEASKLIQEGLNTLLYPLSKPTQMYRLLATIFMIWEATQLLGFCLSSSPVFPWSTLPVMDSIAQVFQVISFGYYIPSGSGLMTAQFAIMLGIAGLLVVLAFYVGIAGHPALDDNRLDVRWAHTPLRWLFVGVSQPLYLPVVQQLISSFRCSSESPFLDSATCWGSGHVVLVVISAILLPLVCLLAAIGVTTVYDHNMGSKDPFARPHGRMLLLIQLIKLACAILFAIDIALDKWPLVVGVIIASASITYLYAVYLPFHWQWLNQLSAGGFAVVSTASIVLILASAKGTALQTGPAWLLLYSSPLAIICGMVLARLQWGLFLADAEINNVYMLELKIRFLLCTNLSESTMDQVDVILSEALRFFPASSILHMFVAQYMAEVRRNQHLERSHLNVLKARDGPFDETFFAYMRLRHLQDDNQYLDHQHVMARVRFEKLRNTVREQVMAARRMQVALWGELHHAQPEVDKVLQLADDLRRITASCDRTFSQMLSLNSGSALVLRMYSQYLREVGNDRTRADELLEQANEIEAAQVRAQNSDKDFIFFSCDVAVDASQDNVALLSASNHPARLGEVIDANATFLHFTGYTKRELMGMNVRMLAPEPISSLHQRYLEAYQETGRGIIINTNRAVFLVHKAGYLVPASQSIRAMDDSFSVVSQPISTSDNFLLVTMPAFKISGMCQRTMARSGASAKALREGLMSIVDVLPTFAAVWEQHELATQQYEAAALQSADARDAAFGSTLTLPTSMTYTMPMRLAALHDGQVMEVCVRLQHITVTNASFVVVKWTHLDRPEGNASGMNRSKSSSGTALVTADGTRVSDSESASVVSDVSLSHHHHHRHHGATDEDADEAEDDGSAGGSMSVGGDEGSQHSGDEEDADADDTAGQQDLDSKATPGSFSPSPRRRGVQFARTQSHDSLTRQTAAKAPQTAAAKAAVARSKSKANIGSGQSSQGSSSSSSHGALQRMLDRASKVTTPSVRRLHQALVIVLSVTAAVIVGNYVYSNAVLQTANAGLGRILQVGDYMITMLRGGVWMQDLVLATTGVMPRTPAQVTQYRADLTTILDHFDELHRGLYTYAQTDPAAYARFTTNDIHVDRIDSYGRQTSAFINGLTAGVSMIAEGRLALTSPLDTFTEANKHIWYYLQNTDSLTDTMHEFLKFYYVYCAQLLLDAAAVRLYVLLAVLGCLCALSLALILPSLYLIRAARARVLSVFLEIPASVLKALHRQSEMWLAQAIQAQDEENSDEAGGAGAMDDEQDREVDAGTIIAAVEAAAAAATAGTPDEHKVSRGFTQSHLTTCLWMGRFFIPVVAALGLLIGLYFWGAYVTESQASYAVELHLTPELRLYPLICWYHLRKALLQTNTTAATHLWRGVQADADEWADVEHQVMFGDPLYSELPVEFRSALRFQTISDLFLHQACVTPADATCYTFSGGLFTSGLHAVINEDIRLMGQTVSRQLTRLGTHPAFDMDYVKAELAAPDILNYDTQIHKYLKGAHVYLIDYIHGAILDEGDLYLSGLIAVTIVSVACILIVYVAFYRRLLFQVNNQLHTGARLVLMLPEEVLRGLPTVRQVLKQQHVVI